MRERKGWVGQPKGLMQVLRERGWIDEDHIEKYAMDLPKDHEGEALEGAENGSLKLLMASFLNLLKGWQHYNMSDTNLVFLLSSRQNSMLKWQAKESNTVGELMSLFLGFIERTNTIQVLIESCRYPFAKLTCCGF